MYQTKRSQRMRNGHKRIGKISRGGFFKQAIYNKETGEIRTVVHQVQKPFKNTGSIMKFMERHGIRPSTIIANGFKKPKGAALKLERKKIRLGISTLSRREREIVMSKS